MNERMNREQKDIFEIEKTSDSDISLVFLGGERFPQLAHFICVFSLFLFSLPLLVRKTNSFHFSFFIFIESFCWGEQKQQR